VGFVCQAIHSLVKSTTIQGWKTITIAPHQKIDSLIVLTRKNQPTSSFRKLAILFPAKLRKKKKRENHH
jgi:hypothetical protein